MSYNAYDIYADCKGKSLDDFIKKFRELQEVNQLKFINFLIANLSDDSYDDIIVDLCYDDSNSVYLVRSTEGNIITTGTLPEGWIVADMSQWNKK